MRSLPEPWRVKVVEKIHLLPREERERLLIEGGYNLFKIPSEAVFIDASNAPLTADFVPSANFVATGRKANTSTVRMPINNAPITAQMATTDVSCVTSGCVSPASLVSIVGS